MPTSTGAQNLGTGSGYKSMETKTKLRLYIHDDPPPVHSHLRTTISKSGPAKIPIVVAKGEETFTPMFCQLAVISTSRFKSPYVQYSEIIVVDMPVISRCSLK